MNKAEEVLRLETERRELKAQRKKAKEAARGSRRVRSYARKRLKVRRKDISHAVLVRSYRSNMFNLRRQHWAVHFHDESCVEVYIAEQMGGEVEYSLPQLDNT